MKQNEIQISMTEFVNFINASGMARMTIVAKAKAKHEEIEGNPYDYWKDFKEEVKRQLKNNGSKEDFLEMLESVREEVRSNYQEMVNGFLRFWKPTRMKWFKPVNHKASIGGVKMIVNPEIGILWGNRRLMIKLYLKANENLDKRHADIVLALMESELRGRVDPDIEFAVLDVRRGKLFKYVNNDPRLKVLLKAEGRAFSNMWKDI
jgi:hypothetical protein